MSSIDELLHATFASLARRLPESTYRLQFHAGFTFDDAVGIADYLHDLGVTDCYASPYLTARPGSTHGYDVVDHSCINPELGGEAGLLRWVDALSRHGMSHIVDTVPNHAGIATNDNAWWNDILKNGPASKYAGFFDIAWRDSPRPELRDKVLLPVLGAPYGQVLEKGELKLYQEHGGWVVRYFDRTFPVLLPNSPGIDPASLNGTPGDRHSFDRLDELLGRQPYRLAYWRTAADEINYRRFFDINDLAALRQEDPHVFDATHALTLRLAAEGTVAGLRVDHPDGLFDPRQYFQDLQREYVVACVERAWKVDPTPAHEDWQQALPALRQRIDTVLASTDRADLPLYVVVEKILAADERLRSDWPVHGTSGYDFLNICNGLFVDPAGRELLSRIYQRFTNQMLVFAEVAHQKKKRVLTTSFGSELHMLAHRLDRLAQKDRHSRDFTLSGLCRALREMIACLSVYRTYVTIRGADAEDARRIESAFADAQRRNPAIDPAIFHFIRDTLLLRYPSRPSVEHRQEHSELNDQTPAVQGSPAVVSAKSAAGALTGRMSAPATAGEGTGGTTKIAQGHFAGRFQQLTAPVTAKGIEDTAFYVYNRLLSLNEVGGDPERFGIAADALHEYLADRQSNWPHALSALSTHDNKRGEDARARINVLSEMPDQWDRRLEGWSRLNEKHRTPVGPDAAPDRNEQYMLYQSLLGAWPMPATQTIAPTGARGDPGRSEDPALSLSKGFHPSRPETPRFTPGNDWPGFVDRILTYAQKALREAKVHTTWTDPDSAYENAVARFVSRILDPGTSTEFLSDFSDFASRISHWGVLNSLSQTLLRLAAPGTADTYQGSELWDLSLVDPDNRRPVDYALRRRLLNQINQRMRDLCGNRRDLTRELIANWEDGRVKLYVTAQVLRLRRQNPGLFTRGEYIPLAVAGPRSRHVFAFARRLGDKLAIAILPRLLAGLVPDGQSLPIGAAVWHGTRCLMPGALANVSVHDLFTGAPIEVDRGTIPMAAALAHFPIGLLT